MIEILLGPTPDRGNQSIILFYKNIFIMRGSYRVAHLSIQDMLRFFLECVDIISVKLSNICLLITGSREPVIFQLEGFCQSWGLVWDIVPFISVFLIAVLSISRFLLNFDSVNVFK